MGRLWLAVVCFLFVVLPLHAHVGSANVYYEGDAGPYHLFVTVVLPKVVPGIAELQVRCATPGVQEIEVVPMRLSGSGSSFSAVPDRALPSKADAQFFVSNLWLMEFGAMKVQVTVHGTQGTAVLSVPIASYARQALPMTKKTRFLLGFLAVLLTCGLILVPSALVRESMVSAGARPQKADLRRGRAVMALSAVLAFFMLYQGGSAWKAQAAVYDGYVNLLKPPALSTVLKGDQLYVRPDGPLRVPQVGQDGQTEEVKLNQLLPDHGHLMHLFLIDDQGMRGMWHLHPERQADGTFVHRLPSMPAGHYKVFADIVDRSGYPWTLVGDTQISGITGNSLLEDDSSWIGPALRSPVTSEFTSPLRDGVSIKFDRTASPFRANQASILHFTVYGSDSTPARDLEPYMGMAAHAEVVSSDYGVFAHLHPSGSVAMASLAIADSGDMATSSHAMPGMMMGNHPISPELRFPFGFPSSGLYRIFVQVKRHGEPESAAFDVQVQ